MRLTLRNLLRYLDQSDLRAIERSRLEQLVDESEKAEAWIQRIVSLRRDKRSGAPDLHSDDPSLNRVASYLESSMGESDTIEFERAMLGSDKVLAEVASCHAISVSVRGQDNPNIPILLRQSVYDLGRELTETNYHDIQKHDGATVDRQVAQLAAKMNDLAFVDGSPQDPSTLTDSTDVPDEADEEPISFDQLSKQAQRKSYMLMASLLAIAAGLLALTYYLGWQAGRQPMELAGRSAADSTAPEDSNESPIDPDADSDEGNSETSNDDTATSLTDNDDGSTTIDTPDNTDTTTTAVLHTVAEPEPPSEVVEPADDALPTRPLLAFANPADATEPEGSNTKVDEPPLEVAKRESPDEVLFQQFPTAAGGTQWQLTELSSAVKERDELLVLTGCQVSLDFDSKVSVIVFGPAKFSIANRDKASQVDALDLKYGRVQIRSLLEDVDLDVIHNQKRYRINFPIQDSQVTVDLRSFANPGSDTRTVTPATVQALQVNSGRVNLAQGDQQWRLPQDWGLALSHSDDPKLVNELRTGLIETPVPEIPHVQRTKERIQRYIDNLPELLADPEGLQNRLYELKGSARQEIRSASLTWLADIGNFDYLVDYLNDDENKSHWRSVIEAVQTAIVNEPAYAGRLFQALASRIDPANQQIMYKLIIGYSPEELAKDGDDQLVELLNFDGVLGVRVLAIERIRAITGGLTYGYLPYEERKKRRRKIESWNKVLKSGQLAFRQVPKLPFPAFAVQGLPNQANDADDPQEPVAPVPQTPPEQEGSSEKVDAGSGSGSR